MKPGKHLPEKSRKKDLFSEGIPLRPQFTLTPLQDDCFKVLEGGQVTRLQLTVRPGALGHRSMEPLDNSKVRSAKERSSTEDEAWNQ
jgi:hypothetical protein